MLLIFQLNNFCKFSQKITACKTDKLSQAVIFIHFLAIHLLMAQPAYQQ